MRGLTAMLILCAAVAVANPYSPIVIGTNGVISSVTTSGPSAVVSASVSNMTALLSMNISTNWRFVVTATNTLSAQYYDGGTNWAEKWNVNP